LEKAAEGLTLLVSIRATCGGIHRWASPYSTSALVKAGEDHP
jgi:hypothetical protein